MKNYQKEIQNKEINEEQAEQNAIQGENAAAIEGNKSAEQGATGQNLEEILSPALEDYIETIALLKKEKDYARISDIAEALNVKSSSANAAIKFLADNGLVMHEKYGPITLTEKGRIAAQEVQKKHDVLFNFLSQLLFIDKETAKQEACAIEHSISAATIIKLERFYELMKKHLTSTEEATKTLQNYLDGK
jgi:DtxR family Mn-dependent transcriptional regulator